MEKCKHKWELLDGFQPIYEGVEYQVRFICRKCKRYKQEDYKELKVK